MTPDIPGEQPDHSGASAPDPLHVFFTELPDGARDVTELQGDTATPAIAEALPIDTNLTDRLAQTERLLETTVLEVASLKAELETLVSVIDDIRARQSSRVTAPAVPPDTRHARLTRLGAAVVAVLLVVVGFALWGVRAVTSTLMAEPPAQDNAPAEPVFPTALATSPVEPPAQIQNASVSSPMPPATEAPARQIVTQPAGPAPAQPAPAAPAPAPYVGTLTIDASPDGEVFLNRKSVGRTPLRLEKLRAGSHLIWIEREGHRRWTRVVAVAADRISRVSADLDPLPR